MITEDGKASMINCSLELKASKMAHVNSTYILLVKKFLMAMTEFNSAGKETIFW